MPRVYDKDPYVILGVPPTATAGQIKEAYRSLARKYHPDLNKDVRAADKMKDINWANDILSSPDERSLYDAWRHATFRVGIPPNPNPPPREPPPSYKNTSYGPPPRAASANPMHTPRAQGCSSGLIIWFLLMVLANLFRSVGSPSGSNPMIVASPETQTAQAEKLASVLATFAAAQQVTPPVGSITPRPLYLTLFAPTSTPTVLRDEFGHEDVRLKFVPGSQEWEWTKQYFPELTTADGLSDEVTFIYWDQLQRGYVIKTQQSGTFIISVYGGQVTAGRYGPDAAAPTEVLTSTPTP
jgi:hypothetical protein